MSRGFHAFFRQYYNLRALLRRADPGAGATGPADGLPAGAGRRARGLLRPGAAYAAAEPGRLRRPEPVVHPARSGGGGRRRRRWSCSTWTSRAPSPRTTGRAPRTSWTGCASRPGPGISRWRCSRAASSPHPSEFSAGELVAMFHAYFLGFVGGAALRRPGRRLRHRALGAAGPLSRRARGGGPHRGAGGRAVRRTASGSARARGLRCAASAVVLATDPATTRGLLVDCRPRRRGVPGPGGRDADRPAVRGLAALAGPAGRSRSAAVPGHRRLRAAGQHLGAGTVRGRAPGAGRTTAADRWSSCTRTRWSGTLDEAALRTSLRAELDRIYPELAGASVVAEEWLVRADCPLAGTGPWRDRLTVRTPDPRDRAGRRRHPLRLPGGPDGAGRDHRLPGRQRSCSPTAAWPATTSGPSRCAPATASPAPCTASSPAPDAPHPCGFERCVRFSRWTPVTPAYSARTRRAVRGPT